MNTPKISVILPCYNHSKYLKERIKSIKSQTLKPSEIIFLDDASTDNSVQVAKTELHGFNCAFQFVINSKNTGSPFAQWNRGIELASHELIWIAETDDSCSPIFLRELYDAMQKNEAVISFAQSRLISETGREIESVLHYTNIHWPGCFEADFGCPGKEFNAKFMARLNAIPNASGVLISRDAAMRAGRANPAMRFCGDWDFWLRLAAQGSVSFIASELNYFRCHDKTTRSQRPSSQLLAEKFACRVSACFLSNQPAQAIGRNNSSQDTLATIGPLNIAKVLRSTKKNDMLFAIKELNTLMLVQTIASYRQMQDIPQLSSAGWAIVAAINLAINTKHQIMVAGSGFIRRWTARSLCLPAEKYQQADQSR